MRVYNSVEEFSEYSLKNKKVKNPVVTTGTFDGVHLGHQKIISRLKDVAEATGGETVLLTFYPHPRMVLFPDDNELLLLNSQEEKIKLLEKYGVDHLIIHPFTKEFSRLSSVEFVRNILVNTLRTNKLVIGYNHHFGRNREGSFEHLKEYSHLYNFSVEEIPAQDVDHVEVSSTKIRHSLQDGDIKTAFTCMGHHYSLTGKVEGGKKIGRKIGYPTANVVIENKYKLIPYDGVYAVQVKQGDNLYGGMLNIGYNPTVHGTSKTIEVNIFDFDKDIYNEEVTIYFIERMRDEIKFAGLEELKNQLFLDKQNAHRIVNELKAVNEK